MSIAVGNAISPVFLITGSGGEPPEPPTLLMLQLFGDEVNITWFEGATNETGYKVYRSADGILFIEIADLPAGSSSYVDSGPGPSDAWYYYVASYNDFGESPSVVESISTYLLRDEFLTDDPAPITDPRNCEPGPGILDAISGQANTSILNDELVIASTANLRSTTTFTRSAGVMIRVTERVVSGPCRGFRGWHTTAGARLYVVESNTVWENGVMVAAISAVNNDNITYSILRDTGCFHVMDIVGSVRLYWISVGLSTTPVQIAIQQAGAAGTIGFTGLRVWKLPSPWQTDYGIADIHETPGVSGTNYEAQADGFYDLIITAPAVLAGDAGLRFRVQDASNYLYAYFDSAGSLRLDRVVAGVPTNLQSVAGIMAAGGTRTLRVRTDGTEVRLFTLNGTTWTVQAAVTEATYQTETTLTPNASALWTIGGGSLGQLDAFPRYITGAALTALEAG